MAQWTEPRTWIGGERGIPASVMNTHIADNLQWLFDTYTGVRGAYKDITTWTIPSASQFTEIASLELDSRHEAILLTVVGNFPPGSELEYHIDTNPDLIILDFSSETNRKAVAKQWIIPSLVTGQHEVFLLAKGSGEIRSLQFDIRELT